MRRVPRARVARCAAGLAVGLAASAVSGTLAFSLVASARSGPLIGGLVAQVGLPGQGNALASPGPTVCGVLPLCQVTPPPTPTPPSASVPCVVNCSPAGGGGIPNTGGPPGVSPGNGTSNRGNGGGSASVAASPAPASGAAGVAGGPPSAGTAGLRGGRLVAPPPSSITLPTAVSGINFGKAPFLWPLFLGLDLLGLGGVVLVLRKFWSRPVTD